jgi:hypothetical protein
MNEQEKQAYHKIRREHPSVSVSGAYQWMKDEQKQLQPIEWKEPKNQGSYHTPIRFADFDHDGFHVHVNIIYDYDHDWCFCRGKFTDTWEPGAVKNPGWYRNQREVCQWFIPDTTEEEHRKRYQELGYSAEDAKNLARSHVLEDCKIAADPDAAGYVALGITATARLKGVELGSDGLWGIEIESLDDPYILQTAWEIIGEAISIARKNLEALKSA